MTPPSPRHHREESPRGNEQSSGRSPMSPQYSPLSSPQYGLDSPHYSPLGHRLQYDSSESPRYSPNPSPRYTPPGSPPRVAAPTVTQNRLAELNNNPMVTARQDDEVIFVENRAPPRNRSTNQLRERHNTSTQHRESTGSTAHSPSVMEELRAIRTSIDKIAALTSRLPVLEAAIREHAQRLDDVVHDQDTIRQAETAIAAGVDAIATRIPSPPAVPIQINVKLSSCWTLPNQCNGARVIVHVVTASHQLYAYYSLEGVYLTRISYEARASDRAGHRDMERRLKAMTARWIQSWNIGTIVNQAHNSRHTTNMPRTLLLCPCLPSRLHGREKHTNSANCKTRRLAQEIFLQFRHELAQQHFKAIKTLAMTYDPNM